MNPHLQQILHDISARIAALEEAQTEPAEWMKPDALCDKGCLYARTKGFTQFPECATKREWISLTNEELRQIEETTTFSQDESFLTALMRNIEAKLKERNT